MSLSGDERGETSAVRRLKPTKCPAKKKKEARKAKIEGGEKVKSNSQDSCVTFKPKHYLKILLSAHARTSQTNILYQHQKAAKCMTCKLLCGKF